MKLSPEERKERIKECNKRRYQNMTEEQKEERREENIIREDIKIGLRNGRIKQ